METSRGGMPGNPGEQPLFHRDRQDEQDKFEQTQDLARTWLILPILFIPVNSWPAKTGTPSRGTPGPAPAGLVNCPGPGFRRLDLTGSPARMPERPHRNVALKGFGPMRITVIGTGYVGLVTGVCLADNGNDVVGCDIDAGKIQALTAGQIPIYEPGLPDLLQANIQAHRIRFTTDANEAIRHGQVVFLAVGTPARTDGSADLTSVEGLVRQIASTAQEPKIVAIKSTVPIGTCDRLQEMVRDLCPHRITVVSNPEFLKEGSALDDFLRPDRVLIGSEDPEAAEVIRQLYAPFVRNAKPILVLSRRAAEMSKYAANAYLAMRISFINEMARLCEALDVDINEVRGGIGSDSRIGNHFLYPSPGYGGSCFPKDVQALAHLAQHNGVRAHLTEAVHEVNQRQQRRLIEKILARFGSGGVRGRRFAIWGVTFKARTDDIRESPALPLIDSLLADQAQVVAHDPQGLANLHKRYCERVRYEPDIYASLRDADALVIVTEWNLFRSPDFARMKALMKAPILFDGRNLYDLSQMRSEGFEYHSIGRRSVIPGGSVA
jgi:UDPglucose 6-dehydrogenase